MLEPDRIAIDQFTTRPQSFEEDVALFARLGASQVELTERKLSSDAGEARGQLDRFFEAGLQLVSVQPRVHALYPDRMSDEPVDPQQRMARYRQTIDRFADLPHPEDMPLVTIAGRAPDHNHREAWRTARALYPELADYAADRGLRIAFEPEHPVLMNIDTFVVTVDDAVRLVDAVDRPNFGLTFDTWHLWQERDLPQRIAQIVDRIFVVHVGDASIERPRHTDDRLIPGQGDIDVPGLIAALEDAGYRGAYCIELLSDERLPDSLWQADPAWVIEESRRGLQRAWQAVEAG